MEPLVWLKGAGVSLGRRPVLRDIDIELGPSQSIGVVGPNGSGKTTLIRLVATLVKLDAGDGSVLGAGLGTEEMFTVRSSIGLLGHTPALIDELTLRENLVHVARLTGIDPTRVEKALAVVGLDGAGERRADASSHGMKRRAEIATLLLRRPRLLLLDEAASGLDQAASALIDALIDRTFEAGGAGIMVSHDRSQLHRCDAIFSLPSARFEEAR